MSLCRFENVKIDQWYLCTDLNMSELVIGVVEHIANWLVVREDCEVRVSTGEIS